MNDKNELNDALKIVGQKYPEIVEFEEAVEVAKKTFDDLSPEEDLLEDYKFSRDKYYELIELGQQAIKELISYASFAQETQPYEAVSRLIKVTAEVTKELLELQKTIKQIENETGNTKNITNNSIYLGSTSDLQKLIKETNKNE